MKLNTLSLQRLCSVIWLVLIPDNSHAYLDPGTGSLLFTALMALVSTIVFWGKSLIHNIRGIIFRVIGWRAKSDHSSDVVIYSEGGQYWNLFKPLVSACERNGLALTYLTSDANDAALFFKSKFFNASFIGKGSRAYMRLNLLEAKICIMTTPGLDVLQIKRSKGVRHYVHLVHAPTTGTYQLFSFDYFDSVMCAGQHQIDSIRELERIRGTSTKTLFETGCCYMDILAEGLDHEASVIGFEWSCSERKTVLVAPSWGEHGLLSRCGEDILRSLLSCGSYNVIVRPHPQSNIVERELLADLKAKFSRCGDKVIWDYSPSGFMALKSADIMISDFSGVVFDFSFVFEKPVLTINFDISLEGLDANDLNNGLWELGKLDQIGRKISLHEISALPCHVEELLTDQNFTSRIRSLRDDSLFNYGNTGDIAFTQIQSLLSNISSDVPN